MKVWLIEDINGNECVVTTQKLRAELPKLEQGTRIVLIKDE